MKNLKLIILITLILLISTISAVSAVDENNTNEESINVINYEIQKENNIPLSEVNVNNWNELKTYCEKNDSNYIIHLKENTNFYPTNLNRSEGQIVINNNVTIIGNNGSYFGDTTPNPQSIKYHPILTRDNSNVSLKIINTTFKWIKTQGWTAKTSGIFIEIGGNTTDNLLENCVFDKITCSDDHSTVYYVKKGQATVKNCKFTNIQTEYGVLSIYDPDNVNIYPYTAKMIIENCYFESNNGGVSSGAINNCGELIVKNSSFNKNTAKWWAGAIHTHSKANSTLINSTFTNNVAGWNGGALYTYSYLQIDNCTFYGNNCTTDNGGGAIGACDHLSTYHITINNSKFEKNNNNCWNIIDESSGTGRGGAISVMDEGSLKIYNTEFIRNTAANGQAIYALYVQGFGDAPIVELINNTFINHTGNSETIELKLNDGKNKTAILKNNTYINTCIQFDPFEIKTSNTTNMKVNHTYHFNININLKNPENYDADILSKINYTLFVNDKLEKELYSNKEFNLTIPNRENLLYVTTDISCVNSKNLIILDKLETNLNITTLSQNNTITIIATVNNNATGIINFTFQNNEYTSEINNGQATLNLTNLKPGTYNITAVYFGDKNYKKTNTTIKIIVDKLTPEMSLIIKNITQDEKNATIIVKLPKDATGNITLSINTKSYNLPLKNGEIDITITDPKIGEYVIIATYPGDMIYKNATVKGILKVTGNKDVKLTLSDADSNNQIIATLTDLNGNPITNEVIIFKIANQTLSTSTTATGKAYITPKLEKGIYNLTAIFNGNDNYKSTNITKIVHINNITEKLNPNMTIIFNKTISKGENATIIVKLPKDATGTIILNINNKTYTSPIKNGELTISIPNLKHGKYNLNIIYSGDNKYNSDNYTDELEVLGNTILKVKNITMIYKDGTRFEAILTDNVGNPIFNVTLSFIINGQTYNKNTDNEGKASIGLNLNAGNYTSVVLYNGSKNYDNIFKNVTITINPTIISKDLVKMYQNDTRFYAKFTDSTGKALANTEIKFNINGVFYTKKTDKDGMADLGIMLRPGSYILTAYNPVTGEEKGFNITVKSLIVQSDLTKYYLNASRFEATVYNKDGSLAVNKEVTFNINGVFYHKKTDENGVASLGIALRPGEYTITTMYDGLDIGNRVSVLPTLVTKDLSMKHLDGSNFTALTLDGQGKPLANQNVSFNVNGVFYHKVTNKDGIASLGIRLMSGEYIITSYWNDFQTGNTIKISP